MTKNQAKKLYKKEKDYVLSLGLEMKESFKQWCKSQYIEIK